MTLFKMRRVNFHLAQLLVLAGAILLLSDSLLRAEPQPGELLELKVATPNGPLVMRFRYCPSGQLLRGKPQPLPTGNGLADKFKRQALLAEMKGFYIGETEVSQEQIVRVLGNKAVEDAFGRMVAAEAAGGRGGEFPIRGITLIEAATFCESLHEFDKGKPLRESGIEIRRFRLPTHDEWQYACRGIRDAEQTMLKPHFNAWPQLADVPKDVVADCNDVWTKKLGEKVPFDGSQDQVLRVVVAHDNPRRGVEILTAFLRLALDTKRNYASPETQPQPVGSGTKNAWNIFSMHGNVFEWTIAEKAPDRVWTIWEMLASGNAAGLSADNSKAFFLAGGSYNYSLGENTSDWVAFSIWGGQKMEEDAAIGYSFAELDNILIQDSAPGFRVLLERVLAKDWLFAIRKASILNGDDDLDAIKQRLANYRSVVAELAAGKELAAAQARINFYEALEVYRAGDPAQCTKLMAASSPALASEDSFFSYFQELADADGQ